MINSIAGAYLASNLGYMLLVVAAVSDLMLPFLLAPFSGRYYHLTMEMSVLGNRNRRCHVIYNIWQVLVGLLFAIGSTKLFADNSENSFVLATCLVIVIMAFAIGACMLSGIFQAGETGEIPTIPEKIHGSGSGLGFLLLNAAPLLIALLSFKTNDFGMGVIAGLCFVLALLFFILYAMADKKEFALTIVSYEGLWQRLSLFCMYAPIVIFSLKKILQ